jgi:hypothetical protein
MFVDTYRKNSNKKICLELNNLVKYVMIIFYIWITEVKVYENLCSRSLCTQL